MEIVVPQRVESVAALVSRAHELDILRLILAHDDRRLVASRGARRRRDLGNDVRRRFVEDLLRGVEAQAVEVEFVDPVARRSR